MRNRLRGSIPRTGFFLFFMTKNQKPRRKYAVPLSERARRLGVSRQRVWQMERKAEGCCVTCGNPCNLYAAHCDEHAVEQRVLMRKRSGCKPWKPGNSGRRPLDVD
jgi:hypothetical protein